MTITARRLASADLAVLSSVGKDVFDDPLNEASAQKFLEDPNSFLVVAQDDEKDDLIIGFASAVTYLHPDKEKPEMVILEVGVSPSYQKQGIGKQIMETMLAEAKRAGCKVAWLATEPENVAALSLYKAAGGKPPETCIHIDFELEK